MGEQHCGERQDKDVLAGPQTQQDCAVKRTRRDRCETMGEPHGGERRHRKWRGRSAAKPWMVERCARCRVGPESRYPLRAAFFFAADFGFNSPT
jgi:hypothetical protein